jgi:serine/threonine protein kinase
VAEEPASVTQVDDGSVADAAGPLLGRVIAGLRFDELIGVGGMGHVFRAEQLALERTVAVKVLHRRLVADDDARTRFTLEARAASRIEHPHVVATHDLDELSDGRPYLVMEFLRGHSLATVLDREGALPLPRALRIVGQVLAALAEGHSFGIVHRDVKPENVVLETTRGGGDHAKLVDFGLAFWTGRSADESGNWVCGTPEYVSPESVRGDAIDGRSDLYSVGVMLFELLTGKRPFEGSTPALTGLRHISEPVPSLRVFAPRSAFPEALDALVMRALAKRPADRFRDANDMGKAVADALEDLGGTGPISLAPSTWDALTCANCKSPNARRQRHCGHCGRRLSDFPTAAAARAVVEPLVPRPPTFSSSRMRMRRASGVFVPFVGRDAELRELQDSLAEAALGVVIRRVEGVPGSGRTTLVDRFLERAEWLGVRAARISPDSFQSRVPFFTVTRLVERLQALGDAVLALPLDTRKALARDLASGHSAGLRRGLKALIEASAPSDGGAPLVLVIDDWDEVDGPSRHVIESVLEECAGISMLFVAVHRPDAPMAHFAASAALRVGPLPLDQATAFLREQGVPFSIAEAVTPLHLEHLVRFAYEAPGRIPPKQLGDLLHERMSLLERDTRRTLELISVIPGGADDDLLATHLPGIFGISDRVAILRDAGFAVSGAFGHRVSHPLVAGIALGAMALEVRRKLYAHSFAVLSERGAPPEALAARAEEAGQPLRAMAILERAGIERQRLGERDAAYDVFTRALAMARRELLRAEFEHAEGVFVGIALRLSRLLLERRDFATAMGLLDEAHLIAGDRPRDLVLVLAEKAHLEAERHAFDKATAFLEEATTIARREADGALIRKLVDIEASMRRASDAVKWMSIPPPKGTA